MFLDFFYALRLHRVPVTTHNWLALMQALAGGLHEDSLDGFYKVARCLLVSSEGHYDAFDQAFAETFRGVERDLSKITEYMANSPHPGKELTEGYFGFAGHNDPVAFRKIAIKELQ